MASPATRFGEGLALTKKVNRSPIEQNMAILPFLVAARLNRCRHLNLIPCD